jgi:Uma2 family endonuclease
MTYDDLMALPDDGQRHKLVRGEILSMPPPKGTLGGIEWALAEAIGRYLHARASALGWQEADGLAARVRLVGYTAGGEAGMRFSLPDDPDQVRGADALYLTPEQFARAEEALRDDYIPFVPALVAEVVSRTDRADDVAEKVDDYLAGGAHLVWVLYPRTRTVAVYTPEGAARIIPAGGLLDGGEVLLGFTVALDSLFL